LRVRLFSVTVWTTFSRAPASISASISSDFDQGPEEPGEVRDDLVGNPPGIAADAGRIESDTAVRPPRPASADGSARQRLGHLAPRRRLRGRDCDGRGFSLVSGERHLRPNQKAGEVVLGNIDDLTTAQTAVATRGFVEAVGVSERILAPGQEALSVTDGLEQHRRLPEPRQIEVATSCFTATGCPATTALGRAPGAGNRQAPARRFAQQRRVKPGPRIA